MAAARKARPDAVLKTLPDPVQDQLFEICRSPATEDSPGGYAAARQWLRDKHGIDVRSDATFSKFYAWYPFSRPLEMAARFAKQAEDAAKAHPNLEQDSERTAALGQVAFEQMAIQMRDLKGFVSLQKVRLKKGDQTLSARRVALLEKKAAQADAAEGIVKDGKLTEEQRAARLREVFGM